MSRALDEFNKYSGLWSRIRDADITEFMATQPKITDFERKIVFYEELEQQFTLDLCPRNVGPVAISTGRFLSVCLSVCEYGELRCSGIMLTLF